MKKNSFPTYQILINNGINRLMVIISLTISILILLIVGAQQTVHTVREARGMMISLNRANINDIPSFIHWNSQTNRHSQQNSIIRVKTQQSSITATSNHHGREILTSSASKNFLEQKKQTLIPGTKIVYVKGYGFFLYYYQKNSQTTYQLWTSLYDLIQNMLLLLVAITFVTLIILLFGAWWSRRLAKKLSQPTISLVQETRNTIKDAEIDQPTLKVPTSPQEINELGNSFNELLQTQNKRLEREQDFVSNASHELRTPIAAIRGNVNLIKRHGKTHPEVIPESLDFIDEESLRMQTLINNLLSLSRADHADLTLKRLSLSNLVQQIGTQYQTTTDRTITLKINGNVYISADENTLKQVIIALLDNAVKYSKAGTSIVLRVEQTDKVAAVYVEDQGFGIPDDQKKLIFQRFYRVDASRSSEIEGNGLGLSIVAKLVDLNNGTVQVLDNDPQGSIFKISFDAVE